MERLLRPLATRRNVTPGADVTFRKIVYAFGFETSQSDLAVRHENGE